jgi:hypothetical protein
MAWTQVGLAFVTQPEKSYLAESKASVLPACLSSFLLETIEQLVDRHIRDSAVREHPLHRNPYAYETALDNAVTSVVSDNEDTEIA